MKIKKDNIFFMILGLGMFFSSQIIAMWLSPGQKAAYNERLIRQRAAAQKVLGEEGEIKKLNINKLENVSLEQLVDAFNNNVNQREQIFDQIFEIVKSICWVAIIQASSDLNGETAKFEGHLYYEHADYYLQSFDNYKGIMIPLRKGSRVLRIPDYEVLKNLDADAEKLFKSKVVLPEFIIKGIFNNHLGPWTRDIEQLFQKEPLSKFLDLIVKGVQAGYNNLSWGHRWLLLPW